MAGLVPARDRSLIGMSSHNLAERCSRAADFLWHVETLTVVMPFTESPESRDLRSTLQSIGLTVLNGWNCTRGVECDGFEDEQSVLVIVHASDWKSAVNRQRFAADPLLKSAMLCVVTGLVSLPDPSLILGPPMFADARLLLAVAGIGFFSTEGVSNGLVA